MAIDTHVPKNMHKNSHEAMITKEMFSITASSKARMHFGSRKIRSKGMCTVPTVLGTGLTKRNAE
jgi:hypothetical protein